MFRPEEFIVGLTASELSQLRALLNSDEYMEIIEKWEESMDDFNEDE